MLAQDQFVRDHIEAPDTLAVRAVNHPVRVPGRIRRTTAFRTSRGV